MIDEIDLIIPVRATMQLPSEDQIREIQSLVTQKLLEFNCLCPSKAPIYGIKLKITLENNK